MDGRTEMYPQKEIYECLVETFDKSARSWFRQYLRENLNTRKWYLAADYCLRNVDQNNDVMCFSLLPYNIGFDEHKNLVEKLLPRDLKETKRISNDALKLLGDKHFFHFAILLNKDRKVFTHGPESDPRACARKVVQELLDSAIEMDRGNEKIGRLRKLNKLAERTKFNIRLFNDFYILSSLLPFITMLILRDTEPEVVGWFSDRDPMTG